MSGGLHEDVARFQRGEGRLVYARFKTEPDMEPYFLVDGSARQPGLRDFVADELECLMPGCSDRRLRLVDRHQGQNRRRDGFSHYPGAGAHCAESLFHVQAKFLIQRWLREGQPDLTVRAEQATSDRTRRADVMASWPQGSQVAIEVQFSALSIREWLERHESYRRHGIKDVWLFGNVYPHFRTSDRPDQGESVRMSDLYRTCGGEDARVFWLNPMEGTVATPFCVRRVEGHDRSWTVIPSSEDRLAGFRIEPLDAGCELDPDLGLVTPTIRRIMRDSAGYLQAKLDAEEVKHQRDTHTLPKAGTPPERGNFKDRLRPPPLTPEQLEAKAYCAACGRPLPAWQRGGSCSGGCDTKAAMDQPTDTLF